MAIASHGRVPDPAARPTDGSLLEFGIQRKLHGLFETTRRFGTAFRDAATVWRTYCQLRRLRDDQLAELGINRRDIGHVAMFGKDHQRQA